MDPKSIESVNIIKNYKDGNVAEQLVPATKYIKNLIIGNQKRKKEFIESGIVPSFVEILNIKDCTNVELLIQVSSVLGSFACRCDEGAKIVYESGGFIPLCNLLSHSNQKLVESSARSLKILLTAYNQTSIVFGVLQIIYHDKGIQLLTSLLKQPLETIQEIATIILARGCEAFPSKSKELTEYQNKVFEYGAFDQILTMMISSKSKIQEHCLYAIEAFTRDNATLSKHVVNRSHSEYTELKCIIEQSKSNSPRAKLSAATVICNIYQTKSLPACYLPLISQLLPIIIRLMSENNNSTANQQQQQQQLVLLNQSTSLTPSIFSDEEEKQSIREDVPAFIARIVSESEDLQRVATECETITTLVSYIKDIKSSDKLLENALSAMAVLTSQREDSRKQVADSKVIPTIVGLLSNERPLIRAAACRCIKSLSRSIRQLRTSLYDSDVGQPVAKLIVDPILEVRVTALASLCNLVLDFSPMKQEMIDCGILKKLVEYTMDNNQDYQIRLNSFWAIKNLLYMSEPLIKEELVKLLPLEQLVTLIKESPTPIVEQTISIIRNLAFKDTTNIITNEHGLLFIKLFESLFSNQTQSLTPSIVKQSLFVICNLASNKELHRNQIINNQNLLSKLLNFLQSNNNISNEETKIAAIWCLSNLVMMEDQTKESRVTKLKEMGCKDILNQIVTNESNEELKNRAQSLIVHLV